ncbi:MAG TPA: ferrochelatase, partial [Nitrospira sp.]|nr:ferrochelatase [Nitrospira sp.]
RSNEPWLGPTVEAMLETIQQAGHRHVLVAPIGFICDHVETLFDIDIELKQLATSKGLHLERMAMLNDSSAILETLRDVLATHESTSCLPS